MQVILVEETNIAVVVTSPNLHLRNGDFMKLAPIIVITCPPSVNENEGSTCSSNIGWKYSKVVVASN